MPEQPSDPRREPEAVVPAPLASSDAGQALAPVSSAVAEAFLAHSNDLMVLFDRDGTISWASPSSQRLFGVPPSKLVGRNGFDMIHPDDHDRAFAAFASIPNLGDQVRVELRIAGTADRPRWIEEVVTNLLDEPEVGGMVGHLRDITERRETEAAVRFQASVVNAVGQAITARDVHGIATYWNAAATDLFGWTAEEMIGRRMGDLIAPAPGYEERLGAAYDAHVEARHWSDEVAVICKGGRVVHVQTMATPVFGDDGQLLGTITASNDLTDILEQRRRIEDDHQRMADAQASAHLGSFELDRRSGEFLGSQELWRILGREPCRLEAYEHVHPDDVPMFRRAFHEAVGGRSDVACTHRIVRLDGVIRWVITRSSRRRTADATILSGTVLDITERHEAEQALLHQATHDPLTGLANRRLFMDQLEEVLARDPDAAEPVAVLFVDLDGFKSVNDRLGHVDADDVLRQLGERITAVVPDAGAVGRLGGDEFVVWLSGAGDSEHLQVLAGEVHASIRRPVVINDDLLVLDASIGIAVTVAGANRRAKDLLRNADTALYAAKQRGGGRTEIFDEALDERDRLRTQLVTALRAALDAGDLVTYYQPEIDLTTGALFGFEALARWPHRERGMVGPDEFIPLAEETGLIGPLGRLMLANACRALAHWNTLRPEPALTVGVNVSPFQLADPSFPDHVRLAIETNALSPAQVCIEVTESALQDEQAAATAISRLHALGVTIAIDDFGTGYSSFGRLKDLPVDFLKIDRSFVADIGRSAADDVIVKTMTRMAHSLGVQLIAEGIETDAQHRFLRDLGCAYGQGYLWSHPLTETDAAALIKREQVDTDRPER